MDILKVIKLNKTFKGGLFEKNRQVLKDVTFSLPQGETSGFVGNNGSGKTTTIKCLFDFIRPDSGEVLFFDKELSAELRVKVGYLPERPYFYEFLTGMELLRLHWNLCYGGFRKNFIEEAHRALKRVDLFHAKDLRLRTYSKGMLQRIGIAQAILTRPELIILDEPMSGLDPDGRSLVKEILRAEKERGVSLFFSSHLLQDMEELCSHLIVINEGSILYDGKLREFMAEYQNLETAFAISKKNRGQNV